MIFYNNSLNNEIIFLDRFQSLYPNGTIIRFECDSKKYNQAASIQCINGEWHSQLLPCGI